MIFFCYSPHDNESVGCFSVRTVELKYVHWMEMFENIDIQLMIICHGPLFKPFYRKISWRLCVSMRSGLKYQGRQERL